MWKPESIYLSRALSDGPIQTHLVAGEFGFVVGGRSELRAFGRDLEKF